MHEEPTVPYTVYGHQMYQNIPGPSALTLRTYLQKWKTKLHQSISLFDFDNTFFLLISQ